MKVVAIASTALLLGACTAAAEGPSSAAPAEADNPLATVAAIGPPEACLPVTQIRGSTGISERAIIFETSSGLYRNELPSACPGAERDAAFSYRTSIARLCRGEILTFFDAAAQVPYGSCALGEFVPIPEDAPEMVDED